MYNKKAKKQIQRLMRKHNITAREALMQTRIHIEVPLQKILPVVLDMVQAPPDDLDMQFEALNSLLVLSSPGTKMNNDIEKAIINNYHDAYNYASYYKQITQQFYEDQKLEP